MEVVGFVGSPRKHASTDTLVSAALDGARSAGAATSRIYLNDLRIAPCQACATFPVDGFCHFHDDMDQVYEALQRSCAVVIGTPAYYGSISAQLKLMIDRSNCVAEMVREPGAKTAFRPRMPDRKKALFIWVANISRDASHALASMRIWCAMSNFELADTLALTGSGDSETAAVTQNLVGKAFEAGRSLAVAYLGGTGAEWYQ